jgi:predicted GNAT family N-acyltransferase
LIGRLARDQRVRGKGVGDLLFADAVGRILSAASTLAVFAIVVEAENEQAAAFYSDFGFLPFPNRPLRLFIPVTDAIEAMSRAHSG